MILPIYDGGMEHKVTGYVASEHITTVRWDHHGLRSDMTECNWLVTGTLVGVKGKVVLTPYLDTEADAEAEAMRIMAHRYDDAQPDVLVYDTSDSKVADLINAQPLSAFGTTTGAQPYYRDVQRELSPKETAVLAACGSPNKPTTDALGRILHCEPMMVEGHVVIRRLVTNGNIEAYTDDDRRVRWRIVSL